MTIKYQFVPNDTVVTRNGAILHRIRSLVDIPRHGVTSGDYGGYIESSDNLSHAGDAWVDDEAWVEGSARVYGDALVCNRAHISQSAEIYGVAVVCDYAQVSGRARIHGAALVSADAMVNGSANVSGHSHITGCCCVGGNAYVFDRAVIGDTVRVSGNVYVFGTQRLTGNACYTGTRIVSDTVAPRVKSKKYWATPKHRAVKQ